MAASGKVQVISTKYFMCINWGHYVIYLQNMKFERLILWPGGAYTDAAHRFIHESWFIGSLGSIPNEPKTLDLSYLHLDLLKVRVSTAYVVLKSRIQWLIIVKENLHFYTLVISNEHSSNKEAFFLRHTTRLPSSTSQLVLFHHLFCIHFWGGSTSVFTSRGSTSVFTSRGVHFCVHFWGSTSMFTSGGVHFHVHFWGGPLLCSLLGGSHVTYPIMLLYAAIECPSASWANSHGTPPTSVFTSGGSTSMFTSGGGGPM